MSTHYWPWWQGLLVATSDIRCGSCVFIYQKRLWARIISVKVLLNIEYHLSRPFWGSIQDIYLWGLHLAVVRRIIRRIVFWRTESVFRLWRWPELFNGWTHIFLFFSLAAFSFFFHSLLCWCSHYSWFSNLSVWFFCLVNHFNWWIGREVAFINWFLCSRFHVHLSQLTLSTTKLCLPLYFDYF